MWKRFENLVELDESVEKKIAIAVNATRDVSDSVPIELVTESWEIVLMDPFELFFKSSEKARLHYSSMFVEIKDLLWEKEKSTKLSVFSHWTNADEIREEETNIFKIFIQIKEWELPREFTIGTILNTKEIENKLLEIKREDIKKYWLDGIRTTESGDWYNQLFQVWIWWWTHNVASSMLALLSAIKSNVLKVFTPNNSNKNSKDYTLRTSLFCNIEWVIICIRMEPKKEKIEKIEKEIEKCKASIRWIITTRPDKQNNKEYDIYAIPSNFETNITKWVKTLVFNWEDREVWEVIWKVIEEVKLFLVHQDNIEIKAILNNLLSDLKNREERLKDINEVFSIEWEWFKDVKKTLNKHKWTTHKRSSISLENLKGFLNKEESTMLDMIIARRFILKDILKYIVMINKIIEDSKNIRWNTDKIMMITDWELWSVWVINTFWYEIFFENLILDIWVMEQRLFSNLEKYTSGVISEKIQNTTWCWDSSIVACMTMREEKIQEIRKNTYIFMFKQLWLNERDYEKAIAIAESFFMSTLQKIISWTVYHCRRSNLWDIPQSKKVLAMLLKYTFWKTIKYIQDWEKWIFKHLYSQDDSSSSKEKKYNWFNTYMITEINS